MGSFIDFDEAVKCRKAAEEKYYKQYSYNNSQEIAREYQEVI